MNIEEYFTKSKKLKDDISFDLLTNEIDNELISVSKFQKIENDHYYVRDQLGKAIHHNSGIDFSFLYPSVSKLVLHNLMINYDNRISICNKEINSDDIRCFNHHVVGDLLINGKKFISAVTNSFAHDNITLTLMVGHIKHAQNDFDEEYSILGTKTDLYDFINYLYNHLKPKSLENLTTSLD